MRPAVKNTRRILALAACLGADCRRGDAPTVAPAARAAFRARVGSRSSTTFTSGTSSRSGPRISRASRPE